MSGIIDLNVMLHAREICLRVLSCLIIVLQSCRGDSSGLGMVGQSGYNA